MLLANACRTREARPVSRVRPATLRASRTRPPANLARAAVLIRPAELSCRPPGSAKPSPGPRFFGAPDRLITSGHNGDMCRACMDRKRRANCDDGILPRRIAMAPAASLPGGSHEPLDLATRYKPSPFSSMNSTRGFNLQFGFYHWLPSRRPRIRGAQSWVELAQAHHAYARPPWTDNSRCIAISFSLFRTQRPIGVPLSNSHPL
jgi:hypothetical protein